VQVGGITNNNYAANAGGGTPVYTNIQDAFDPSNASSHNLSDVLTHAIARFPTTFDANTNACFACHDSHYGERNFPVTIQTSGVGVKTAVRRPDEKGLIPPELWGDEDATSGLNERMSDYTAKHQAPYYLGGTNFEPANNATFDGSNLPNYKNLCTGQCHGRNDVYSTGHGRNLIQINWGTEQHGKGHSGGTLGASIAPYTDPTYNYHLSCLDCHEPHGAENEFLLRSTINGVNVSVPGPGRYWHVCSACHTFNQHFTPYNDTCDCTGNGICHVHNRGTYF
jgi:hypothetical protein